MWVRSIVKGSIPRDWVQLLEAIRHPWQGRQRGPAIDRGGPPGSGSVHTIRCTPVAVNPAMVGPMCRLVTTRCGSDEGAMIVSGFLTSVVHIPPSPECMALGRRCGLPRSSYSINSA